MPVYTVRVMYVEGTTLEIKADSADEARDKAVDIFMQEEHDGDYEADIMHISGDELMPEPLPADFNVASEPRPLKTEVNPGDIITIQWGDPANPQYETGPFVRHRVIGVRVEYMIVGKDGRHYVGRLYAVQQPK